MKLLPLSKPWNLPRLLFGSLERRSVSWPEIQRLSDPPPRTRLSFEQPSRYSTCCTEVWQSLFVPSSHPPFFLVGQQCAGNCPPLSCPHWSGIHLQCQIPPSLVSTAIPRQDRVSHSLACRKGFLFGLEADCTFAAHS